ncbi:MAG: hypothetical protein RHS_1581 [Robinsoniella sp. RHS]|nr:MAG: hypothetical protein RHS_1581 [Robinsoniella sp. RHS]
MGVNIPCITPKIDIKNALFPICFPMLWVITIAITGNVKNNISTCILCAVSFICLLNSACNTLACILIAASFRLIP